MLANLTARVFRPWVHLDACPCWRNRRISVKANIAKTVNHVHPTFKPLCRSVNVSEVLCLVSRTHSNADNLTTWQQGLYLDKIIASAGNFPHERDIPGAVSRKSRNFSGDIILFASWKRKRSKTRNFAVILIFLPFTSCGKTSFTEQAGRSFTEGFSDPKTFRDFRETGHRSFSVYTAPRRTSHVQTQERGNNFFFVTTQL